MKRSISILLLVSMVLTIILPSFTYADNEYDKKMEQAIIKVKDIFNISDEYDKFEYEVNS